MRIFLFYFKRLSPAAFCFKSSQRSQNTTIHSLGILAGPDISGYAQFGVSGKLIYFVPLAFYLFLSSLSLFLSYISLISSTAVLPITATCCRKRNFFTLRQFRHTTPTVCRLIPPIRYRKQKKILFFLKSHYFSYTLPCKQAQMPQTYTN